MSTELREAVVIGIELILFSILIVLISFFGRYAQNAFILKNAQDETMNDIAEYRDLYEFTSGAEIDIDVLANKGISRTVNGNYTNLSESKIVDIFRVIMNNNALQKKDIPGYMIVKGDDIVRLAALFNHEYDILIANLDNVGVNGNILISNDERFEDSTYHISNILKLKDGEEWGIAEINKVLDAEITEEFYCFAVYDTYYYKYDCVVFLRKTS